MMSAKLNKFKNIRISRLLNKPHLVSLCGAK